MVVWIPIQMRTTFGEWIGVSALFSDEYSPKSFSLLVGLSTVGAIVPQKKKIDAEWERPFHCVIRPLHLPVEFVFGINKQSPLI